MYANLSGTGRVVCEQMAEVMRVRSKGQRRSCAQSVRSVGRGGRAGSTARTLRVGAGSEVGLPTREKWSGERERQSMEDPVRKQATREEKMKGKLKLTGQDDVLEDLPIHVAALATTAALDLMLIAQGMSDGSTNVLEGLGVVALGYILADLGSGVFHWSVDNYGNRDTPVLGNVIAAFQGHHRQPWSITLRGAANNLFPLAKPIAPMLALALALPLDGDAKLFLGSFGTFVMLSQQFHRLSHFKRSDLSPLVVKMQDLGLLISVKDHGSHHRAPYSCSYCIVNGMWNKPLDDVGFFVGLERLIHYLTGVEPRCWSEPEYDWVDESYYETSE